MPARRAEASATTVLAKVILELRANMARAGVCRRRGRWARGAEWIAGGGKISQNLRRGTRWGVVNGRWYRRFMWNPMWIFVEAPRPVSLIVFIAASIETRGDRDRGGVERPVMRW